MNKILINFAHPKKSRSRINKALRSAIENLDGVTVNDLYATYPDFLIDVKREQALLLEHDVIVFQFPFYWYSTPSIIKEWMDLVLEHGWAYGRNGAALSGKRFLMSLTAGGSESSYSENGANQFTIHELLSPYRAAANLCQIVWLPPFTVFGAHRGLSSAEIAEHAEDYRQCIIALRDEMIDMETATKSEYLNSDLAAIIRRA